MPFSSIASKEPLSNYAAKRSTCHEATLPNRKQVLNWRNNNMLRHWGWPIEPYCAIVCAGQPRGESSQQVSFHRSFEVFTGVAHTRTAPVQIKEHFL